MLSDFVATRHVPACTCFRPPLPPYSTDISKYSVRVGWELSDTSGEPITHCQVGLCRGVNVKTGLSLVSPRGVPTDASTPKRDAADSMMQTLPVKAENRAVFGGLLPGTTVRFRVRLQNVNGWSEWSQPSDAITTMADVPLPPPEPTAFLVGDMQMDIPSKSGDAVSARQFMHDVIVEWGDSPNPRGEPVVAFDLQVRRGGLSDFVHLVRMKYEDFYKPPQPDILLLGDTKREDKPQSPASASPSQTKPQTDESGDAAPEVSEEGANPSEHEDADAVVATATSESTSPAAKPAVEEVVG